MLRSSDLLLPLVLVVVLQAGQQLSGINAVFYYSSSVFQTAGLDPRQAQYATLGCGFINFMTSCLALKLVNMSPRRTLMLTSISMAVLSMSLLALSIFTIVSLLTCFQAIQAAFGICVCHGDPLCSFHEELKTLELFQKSLPWMAFVAVGSVLVYVLFYGFGLGPIPFFIGSGKLKTLSSSFYL